jgi:peptide/nickel transport system ATP-binding protein
MTDRHVLLEVKNLKKYFLRTRGFMKRVLGTVKAVDDVSFFIKQGETLALVGESGCGKTTTGRCLMRAIEPTEGEILFRFDGANTAVDMAHLEKKDLKEIRKAIALVFQDPYSSLNPRMNILETVGEPLVIHREVSSRSELEDRVATLLKMVRLDPEYMRRYPHAFSGGQRQRIAIARALSMRPKFVVADEPVSALDVSVQAQILNLLEELQDEFNLTYLFVAHNLAVIEYVSDRVAVMYVGKLVELADTAELFGDPKHPYTEALLSAVPKPDPRYEKEEIILGGEVADPANPPAGCYFHPRCRYAKDVCAQEEPSFTDVKNDPEHPHFVACHFARELDLLGI